VLGFNILNANAMIPPEEARSADTIIYYIKNPYGNSAEITWSITGGIIVGHSSPYTADGADTIKVIWNDTKKSSVNPGSLKVSEIVKWAGGTSCPSPEEQINVESWVKPKVITDTLALNICSEDSIIIKVYFEGKPEYKYKWRLYEKNNPSQIIEDYTTNFIISNDTITYIKIAGIKNTTGSVQIYEFEITEVHDGLTDKTHGDVSMGKTSIYIQSETSIGTIKNNNQLIRR
jgi:hypothetical protein